MKEGKKLDLGLTGLDKLFSTEQERMESQLPKIYDIPLSEIDDFPDHPYKVKEDEDMDQLVQSIKDNGILTPVTLRRKEDGRYEVVAGHRRKRACELVGIPTLRAEIKDLTRDEAVILMVESNYQRSKILPSEKAFAYKMRLEAMKRQGHRTDLTSDPMGWKSKGAESAAIVGEKNGDGQTQVRRYIRLTNLIPDILEMVDEGRIAFRPAVELSYLSEAEQAYLLEEMTYNDATPSLAQAIKMHSLAKEGKLSSEVIESIMSEEKPNQREKISFRADRLRQYIPDSVPREKTEEYVMRALQHYREYQIRQASRSAR